MEDRNKDFLPLYIAFGFGAAAYFFSEHLTVQMEWSDWIPFGTAMTVWIFSFVVASWWYRRKDKARVPYPGTENWISETDALGIVYDHPAARKHMPVSGLSDLEITLDGKTGRPIHDRYVAEAILDEITHQYPAVLHEGKYSKEIITWALNRRMINT